LSGSSSDKFKKLSRRWVGQVGSGGVADDTVTTIPLSSTTNLPTDTGVVAVIDRVDANGDTTASKEETVIGVVSGSNLTSCTRGAEGTAQAHDAGAVVEILFTAKNWNDVIDGILQDHNQSGYHKTLYDTNGNEWLEQNPVTSAVNQLKISNAATGNNPVVEPSGGDTNVGLDFKVKGTGKHSFTGDADFNDKVSLKDKVQAYGTYDNSNSGTTKTIDWSNGDRQKVSLTGNVTFTFSNAQEGQIITLVMTQDATGGRTVTWPAAVKWPGGSEPSWGTGASDINTATFYYDGTNYLGQGSADYS